MSLEQLLITLEAQGKNLEIIEKAADSIERLEKTAGTLDSVGRSVSAVGESMTRNVTAPIVAGLAESARVAKEFESVMFDVNKAFGFEAGTRQALEAEGVIESLSLELGQLPPNVAAIATEAGKLGVQFEQIEDYTRFVTSVGVAFDMTAQQAGESIGTLTNVLGYMDDQGRVNIEGLEHLGDTINYLADSGATSEAAIASVLQRSGGIVRSFGLANDESAALAAAFLNLGYPPEVVGTAINGMLPALQNATQQTDKFQGALEQIGLPAAEFERLIAQDAAGAIETLLTAIEASGDTSIISRLFGSGSDSAMLTTAVANLDRFKATMDSLENVEAGLMMETFASRTETSTAQMERFRATTYILRNVLGSVLLPAVNDVLDAVTPLIEKFAEFADQNPGVIRMGVAFSLLAAAMGPTLFVAGSLVSTIGNLAKAFNTLKIATAFLSKGGLTKALVPLKAALSGAAFAATALAAILGSVVLAVFKIGGAMMGVDVTWQDVIGGIKLSLQELPQNLAQLPAAIGAIFSMIVSTVKTRIIHIALTFRMLATRMGQVWQQARTAAITGVTQIVQAVRSRVSEMLSAGQQMIQNLASGIQGAIGTAVSAMSSVVNGVLERIRSLAGEAFSAGADIVNRLADGIRSAIGRVTDAVGAVTAAAARLIPGSPVKEGPLTVLNSIASNPGAQIAEMIAAGIQAGSPAVAAAMGGMGNQALAGAVPAANRGTATTSTNTFTFNFPGVSNREEAAAIAGDFEERVRRVLNDVQRNDARVAYS